MYPDDEWQDTLDVIDGGSPFGLTGAIFSRERAAIEEEAGNLHINDKPTGAVVGQRPFGARASGTNDKAGSMWNLIRWVSPRTIKETFDP